MTSRVQHGLLPLTPDKKDKRYLFHRNFGAAKLSGLPDAYTCDAGLTMPDQNEDGRPTECTAITVNELATDQDGIEYTPDYTFAQTLRLQGSSPDQQGADLRKALKSAIAFGLLPVARAPFSAKERGQTFVANWLVWPRELELEAIKNAKASYYGIATGPYDAFDNIRSAIWLNRTYKMGGALGTPWFPEWENPDTEARVPTHTKQFIEYLRGELPWHAWKIAGWVTINGEVYLRGKTWQGKNFGAAGWLLFDRATINRVLAIPGTGAFTLSGQGNRFIFLLGLMTESLPWLLRLLPSLVAIFSTAQNNSPTLPPAPPAAPDLAPPQPLAVPSAPVVKLVDFCTQIRNFEGQPGDRNYKNNNPGNCRYSLGGYLNIYQPVLKDKDGFAVFKDYPTGWLYLQNLVKVKIAAHPTWTIYDFFASWAPTTDDNNPSHYAAVVSKNLGVSPTFLIKNISS